MKKNKKGFTLVELVIVVAVIAILAAVLIPTLASVISRTKATANLQQATSVRDEFYSNNENIVSVKDMEGYVIVVDGIAYKLDQKGGLTVIETSLKDYEKTNKVKLEEHTVTTAGTIFAPVQVLVTEVQAGSYDAEGNMLYTWEELVQAGTVTVNGTTLTGVKDVALAKLVIDDSITEIGASAFYYKRNIKSIVLSKNVHTIGNEAFYNCYMTSFDFNNAPLTKLPYRGFMGSDVKEFIIPEGVKTIGQNCFYANYDLEKVVLPSTIETIDYGAFGHCDKIKEMILPEGLKTIGSCAFSGCTGITTLIIPESVTTIGYYALDLTYGLESIDPEVTYTIRFNFTEATKDVDRDIDSSAIYYPYIIDVFENHRMEKEMAEDEAEWEKEMAEEYGYEYDPNDYIVPDLTGKLNYVLEIYVNPESNDDYYYYDTGINTYCDSLTALIDELYMYGAGYFEYEYSEYADMFNFIIRDISE